MIEITSLGQMLSLVNDRTRVTVIDFYADWCGPCQTIRPEYERVASYYDESKVNFCKCNVDRCRPCASHFNITAMPTFVTCVGGETIETVRGGDLGLVQRSVELALCRVSPAPPPPPPRHSAGPQRSAFAEHMLKIQAAKAGNDMVAEKDACDAAYKLLWEGCSPEHEAATRHPFGVVLLPYLASESFSVDATSALFRQIAMRAAPAYADGELMVNQCLRYLIQLTNTCTWEDMELLQVLHAAVLALLRVPETQPMVTRSVYFDDEFIRTGMGLEQNTLLGALFGVGPFPKGLGMPIDQRNNKEWHVLMTLFPPADKGNHAQSAYKVQQTTEVLAMMNKRVAECLLQSRLTRDATMRFFSRALQLNEDYQKTMHISSPLSTRYFMIQLQSVLIAVALPVFTRGGDGFDASAIPACYVLEDAEHPNQRSVVNFGKDIERVVHFDAATPLPALSASIEPFKPAVHLFFLAARAVTVCATVFIDQHDRSARDATHPMVAQDHRDVYLAEKMLYEGLLGSAELGESRMQYLNGLASWLLCVMGVSKSGELPANPPEEWNYLPQQLVDCAIRAAQMAPINPLSVDNLISLMLVLMGNTQYFPKPHTHALFPAFLIRCLQDRDAKRALEHHPWFASRIVRACIDCYIAVEKCPYDRVQVRYELSYCIKDFLQYDSLCDPVREEFRREGTVLERFSHMAVAEVNESVDQLIESLTKMNTMVKEGADLSETAAGPSTRSGSGGGASQNRQGHRSEEGESSGRGRRVSGNSGNHTSHGGSDNEENEEDEGEEADGTQSYHQLGRNLRSHIMLFKASMGMFIALSQQFPRGVSQNLVAQQISQMLARSLVAFAGPKSGRLKIEHASRYDFNPREVLTTLVECLTRFRRTPSFLRCLCLGGVALDGLQAAMKTVIDRQLVSEELAWKLSEMSAALSSIQQDVDDEETLWDEAPDFALDALLSTPLTHPVALPSEIKDLNDLVYVNHDTIHHLLLSESKHPFTKEYLDEKMVDAFNRKPDVSEHRDKLQKEIAAWLTAAKAKKQAEKLTVTSGGGGVDGGTAAARPAATMTAASAAAAATQQASRPAANEPAEDDDDIKWC